MTVSASSDLSSRLLEQGDDGLVHILGLSQGGDTGLLHDLLLSHLGGLKSVVRVADSALSRRECLSNCKVRVLAMASVCGS